MRAIVGRTGAGADRVGARLGERATRRARGRLRQLAGRAGRRGKASSSCCAPARAAIAARRAAADRTRSSSTRRATGRSRSSPPPVVHPAPRRAPPRAGPRAAMASAVHAVALRELGRRPYRRLVRQPAALLRRAVPGLVPRSRRRRAGLRGRRRPTRRSCRSIRHRRAAGYTAQRGQPNGFIGDPDVMDTWATSSLSPQIAGWGGRPGAVRAAVPDGPPSAGARHHPHLALLDGAARTSSTDSVPWGTHRDLGWVLDPDRKKMSKSKGNVVTPIALLEGHGPTRSATGRQRGRASTSLRRQQMKVGRRLAIKLLNVSKFVLAGVVPSSRVAGVRPRRSTAAARTNLAALVDEVTRRSTTTTMPARSQRVGLLLGLLRQLRRSGSRAATATQVGRAEVAARQALALQSASRWRCGCAVARSAVRHRGSGWSWWRVGSVHRAAGRSRPSCLRWRPGVRTVTRGAGGVRKAKSTPSS